MRRNSLTWVADSVVVICLFCTVPTRGADFATPGNIPAMQQALTAEAVLVGKVIEIEKEATMALPYRNWKEKVEYRVAIIKISDGLAGVNGLTAIRVGFVKRGFVPGTPVLPIFRPKLPNEPPLHVALVEGQEGCFFLRKHHEGDFYVIQQSTEPLDKKAVDFDKHLTSVKKVLKVIESPKDALKSPGAADRQFAACMLVQKYRQPRMAGPIDQIRQESIDAEESKLILMALSEMEWGKVDPNGLSLHEAFYELGLQPKDGWVQPKVQPGMKDYPKIMGEAVTKWMKENADKYRIQRRVEKK